MKEIEVHFNINESKEINCVQDKGGKTRKKTNDDYDYEDPFIELMEDDFEPVELEPHIENFFVYSGKLTEDPKKIIKKYESDLKKSNIKKAKIAQEELMNASKTIAGLSDKKTDTEIESKTVSTSEKASVPKKSKTSKKNENKIVLTEKMKEEIKNEINKPDSIKENINEEKVTEKIDSIEKKEKIRNTNDETSLKKKLSLKEEYYIKNEIIVRNNEKLTEELIFEYFTNALLVYEIKNINIILKKLNLKESKLTDTAYLNEKLEELKLKFDIEKIKLQEFAKQKINNDDFIECLWSITNIRYKIIYFDIFLNNKKRIAEVTAKKSCKNLITEILGENADLYKQWGVKLHYYKKKNFFDQNINFLNNSLYNSDSLMDSENLYKDIESIELSKTS